MLRGLSFRSRALAAAVSVVFCMFLIPAASAQQTQNDPDKPTSDKPSSDSSAKQPPPPPVTIHIEVTGGDKDKPIENASVYVRYNEHHKIKADKLIEMNVKTSMDGKVRVPFVPKGKIMIQVVADGWKPYGRWFDLTDDGQIFKIHMDRPPKWY